MDGRRWREGQGSNGGRWRCGSFCPAAVELAAATPAKLRDDAGEEWLEGRPRMPGIQASSDAVEEKGEMGEECTAPCLSVDGRKVQLTELCR